MIDHSHKIDDDIALLERTKFAKFVGVYYDLRTKGKGYSGPEDVVASALSDHILYIQLKEKYGYSSFPHAHWIDPTSGTQRDGYSCGVIGFKMSLHALDGNFDMLRSDDVLMDNCNKFRRGFYSVMRQMIEFLDPDWKSN